MIGRPRGRPPEKIDEDQQRVPQLDQLVFEPAGMVATEEVEANIGLSCRLARDLIREPYGLTGRPDDRVLTPTIGGQPLASPILHYETGIGVYQAPLWWLKRTDASLEPPPHRFYERAQVGHEFVTPLAPNLWLMVSALGGCKQWVGSDLIVATNGATVWHEDYATGGYLQLRRTVYRYESAKELANGDLEFKGLEALFVVDGYNPLVNAAQRVVGEPVWWVCDLKALDAPELISAEYDVSVNRDLRAVVIAPQICVRNDSDESGWNHEPFLANRGAFGINNGEWYTTEVIGNHSSQTHAVQALRGGVFWSGITNLTAIFPRYGVRLLGPQNWETNQANWVDFTDPSHFAEGLPVFVHPGRYKPEWRLYDLSYADYNPSLKIEIGSAGVLGWSNWPADRALNSITGYPRTILRRYNHTIAESATPAHSISIWYTKCGPGCLFAYLPGRHELVVPNLSTYTYYHENHNQVWSSLGALWGDTPHAGGFYTNSFLRSQGNAMAALTPSMDFYNDQGYAHAYRGGLDSGAEYMFSIQDINYQAPAAAAYGFKTRVQGGDLWISAQWSLMHESQILSLYLRFLSVAPFLDPLDNNQPKVPLSVKEGLWAIHRKPNDRSRTEGSTPFLAPGIANNANNVNAGTIHSLALWYPKASADPSYDPAPIPLPHASQSNATNQARLTSLLDQLWDKRQALIVTDNGRDYYRYDSCDTVPIDPQVGAELTIPEVNVYGLATPEWKENVRFYAVLAKTVVVDGQPRPCVPVHPSADDLVPLEIARVGRAYADYKPKRGIPLYRVELKDVVLSVPPLGSGAQLAGLVVKINALGWSRDEAQSSQWAHFYSWSRAHGNHHFIIDPLAQSIFYGSGSIQMRFARAPQSDFSFYGTLPNTNEWRFARPMQHAWRHSFVVSFSVPKKTTLYSTVVAAVRRGRTLSYASKPIVCESRRGSSLVVTLKLPPGVRDEDALVITTDSDVGQTIVYEKSVRALKAEHPSWNITDPLTIRFEPSYKRRAHFSDAPLPDGPIDQNVDRYIVLSNGRAFVSRLGEPVFDLVSNDPASAYDLPIGDPGAQLTKLEGKPVAVTSSGDYLLVIGQKQESTVVPVSAVLDPVDWPIRLRPVVDQYALERDRVCESGNTILSTLPYARFAQPPLGAGLFTSGTTLWLFYEFPDRYDLYRFEQALRGWLLWRIPKTDDQSALAGARVVSIAPVGETLALCGPSGVCKRNGQLYTVVLVGGDTENALPGTYETGAIRIQRGVRIRKAAVIGNRRWPVQTKAPVRFAIYESHSAGQEHWSTNPPIGPTFAVRTIGHKHESIRVRIDWLDPRFVLSHFELVPAKGANW